MSLQIDVGAIDRSLMRARRGGWDGISVNVRVRGADPADVVASLDRLAAELVLTGGGSIAPSRNGAAVWLNAATTTREEVETLADLLHRQVRSDVFVNVLSERVADWPSPSLALPQLHLGTAIHPPAREGPINQWGQPDYRWSVAPTASDAIFREAARWLDQPDRRLQAATRGVFPVTAEQAPEALRRFLLGDGFMCSLTSHAGNLATRSVTFEPFGASTWTDGDLDRSIKDRVAGLIELLRRHARCCDVAAVHLGPSPGNWAHLDNPYYPMPSMRDSWNRLLPGAFPVLVASSSHLAAVNDLSRWTVENLGHDRYLLKVPDWEAWFLEDDVRYTQFSMWWNGPEMSARRKSAMEDLGDAVLTQQRYEAIAPDDHAGS